MRMDPVVDPLVIRKVQIDHIEAHGLAQVLVEHAEHLEWLVHAHWSLFEAVVIAQCGDATGVDSRDRGSPDIDGNTVGLLMIKSGDESFAAG